MPSKTAKVTSQPFTQPRPDNGSANAYLRTKVLTARPEELRLLLLDGALKFARQGQDGLARRDFEASYNGLSQCRDIITELMSGMRSDLDPALCSRVRALYSFLFSELVEASLQKDPARVGKVVELLEYERETWWLLMQKVAGERGEAAPASGADESGRRPLSLQA